MNIVKETRFVWFVVLLLVVFAFAAHKKGDYDPNDTDHAFTESLPPPPVAPTSCFPGFAYGIFSRGSIDWRGDANIDGWDSGSGAYPTGARRQDGDMGTDGCSGGVVHFWGGAVDTGDVYYGAGCGGSSFAVSGPGSPNFTGSRSQTTNQTLPSVVAPLVGTNLGACAACVVTPDSTYTTVSGAVTFPAGTYVVDTLDPTAAITVSAGPVLIYVTSAAGYTPLSIANSGTASNLVFMVVGAGAITVNQSGTYGLYAPDADITFGNPTTIYGSVVGGTIANNGVLNIHYDRALKLFSGGGYSCTSGEVSRSSPIIATVGGFETVVQGTFNSPITPATTISSLGSVAGWQFPYISGHFRAKKTSALTVAGVTYAGGVATSILFDAADTSAGAAKGKPIGTAVGTPLTVTTAGCGSPAGSTVGTGGTGLDGSCRRIFTNIDTPDAFGLSWHPHVMPLSDGNVGTIGPLMISNAQIAGISGGSYYQTMIRAILNGQLGGIDRSTAAVIGPSTVAGAGTRPTIAYVGGTDGMLHAICASTGGTTASNTTSVCPRLGAELWAFLPRVELPLLASNTQRIDGAPRVVDVFGDFISTTANVTRSWHTILTFQTGFSGVSVGATYALDITDPAAPYVVWEYGTPSAVGALETGVGLVVAAGAALKNGQLLNTAIVETNNGGSGGAGVVTTSLQMENGAKLWRFGYAYPEPPRGVAADDPLPNLGVPGGAVAVDLAGQGTLTDVVFGDLYGDLWRVNILDGLSRNGTSTPLFSFSTNKRPIGVPPAIYADASGSQFAAIASGGFVDPIATRWSGNTQYLVSVKLNNQTGPTVSETGALAPATVCPAAQCPINVALTSGDREYGQLLVVGGQLFLTSDGNDVNTSSYSAASTSHLMVVNTSSGAATTYTLTGGGAGSLVNSGTNIYNATATTQGVLQDGAGAAVTATAATGTSVDTAQIPKITRNLWLRTQ